MESMFTPYMALLVLHSLLRWAPLVVGALVLGQAVQARAVPGEPSRAQRKLALLLLILFDTQVLIGLVLTALSPLVQGAWGQMGMAMKDPVLRFWAVEHPVTMLLAATLMHIGYAKGKRAVSAAAMAKATLTWQAISLLLVVVAIPWPFRAVGRALVPRL